MLHFVVSHNWISTLTNSCQIPMKMLLCRWWFSGEIDTCRSLFTFSALAVSDTTVLLNGKFTLVHTKSRVWKIFKRYDSFSFFSHWIIIVTAWFRTQERIAITQNNICFQAKMLVFFSVHQISEHSLRHWHIAQSVLVLYVSQFWSTRYSLHQ